MINNPKLKKMKNLLYLFVIALFSSCAVHTGTLTGIYTDLGTPYKITGKATGYAKAGYVLGIGGLKKKQLVQDAKEDMYINSPLKMDQIYANVSVNFRNSFFFVYYKTEVYITADIISKKEDDEYFYYLNRIVDEYNKEITIALKKWDISEFVLEEKVYYFNPKSKASKIGYVQAKKEDFYSIAVLQKAPTEIYLKNKNDIYKFENVGELQSLIGQNIMLPNSEVIAIIVAINPFTKDLLVKPEKKKIRSISLDLEK